MNHLHTFIAAFFSLFSLSAYATVGVLQNI